MLHGIVGEGSLGVATRRSFGHLRKLPSKRWQASYIGPDLQRHIAPITFTTKLDAEAWFAGERRLLERDEWTSPSSRGSIVEPDEPSAPPLTVRTYVTQVWLDELDLRPLTRRDYESLLKNHIFPTFADIPLEEISKASVRTWFAGMDKRTPRARSKAYQLLHNIMSSAVDADLIETNPARLPKRVAARPPRGRKIRPLTVDELNTTASAMPPELRLAVTLGCLCALRYGELAELRRRDVDLPGGILRVERAMVRVKGQYLVTAPKTAAGVRDVHIPAPLLKDIRTHLAEHVAADPAALLFPAVSGGHMHSSTFGRHFKAAATAAGRPDATPHILRHTGASLATSAGASTADVMARLGHTTPAMAMVYQHSINGADAKVADQIGALTQAQSRGRRKKAPPH